MSWDELTKSKGENSGKFIKLKDGDSIEGVFRGEPYAFYRIFKDKKEYASFVPGSKFRFKINFLVKNDAGNYSAKILEGGSSIRDDLLEAKEESGLDCIYKIKRRGSGMEDTKYSIFPKEKLSQSELALVNAVHLNPIFPDDSEDENASSRAAHERVPF